MKRIALFTVVINLILASWTDCTVGNDGIPEQLRKQFEFLVGEWEMTGTVAEGDATSTAKVSMCPGGHMIQFNSAWSDPENSSSGSGLFGWDAVENKVHTSEFWSNGFYHHRHFTIKSDKVWEGEQFAGGTKDGKRIKAKVRIEFIGPNEFTFEATNITHDGEKQEDSKLRFRRKAKQR